MSCQKGARGVEILATGRSDWVDRILKPSNFFLRFESSYIIGVSLVQQEFIRSVPRDRSCLCSFVSIASRWERIRPDGLYKVMPHPIRLFPSVVPRRDGDGDGDDGVIPVTISFTH